MINLQVKNNDEGCGYEGIFHIIVKNKKYGTEQEYVIHNRIEDQILNTLIDTLVASGTVDLEIRYLGIGDDGNAQVTPGELNNELERVQNSGGPNRTAVGRVETKFTILDTEANFNIRELGIWVSATATATLNSGVLLSRILWSFDKTSNDEVIINRVDIIRRA